MHVCMYVCSLHVHIECTLLDVHTYILVYMYIHREKGKKEKKKRKETNLHTFIETLLNNVEFLLKKT